MLEKIPTKLISDPFTNTYLLVGSDVDDLVQNVIELPAKVISDIAEKSYDQKAFVDHFETNGKNRTSMGYVCYMGVPSLGTFGILRINTDAARARNETLVNDCKILSEGDSVNFSQLTSSDNVLLANSGRMCYINTCVHETVHWMQPLYIKSSGCNPYSRFLNTDEQVSKVRALSEPLKKWIKEIFVHIIFPLYESVPKEQWVPWKDNPVSIWYDVNGDDDGDHFVINNSSLPKLKGLVIWSNSVDVLALSSINTLNILSMGDVDNYKDSFSYLLDALGDLFFEILLQAIHCNDRRFKIQWSSKNGTEVNASYTAGLFINHYKYLEEILLRTNVIKLK